MDTRAVFIDPLDDRLTAISIGFRGNEALEDVLILPARSRGRLIRAEDIFRNHDAVELA